MEVMATTPPSSGTRTTTHVHVTIHVHVLHVSGVPSVMHVFCVGVGFSC